MMLINGQPATTVTATDRGLAYGDGVFRTLCTDDAGAPVWWDDQYAKLAADCAALGLECPRADTLRAEVGRVADRGAHVIKIIITRGPAVRGYAVAEDGTPTRIVLATARPPDAETGALRDVAARWCTLRLGHQPRLAGVKHLNRLENVLARAEWQDPAIAEGLLCDTDGVVVCGVSSNLFWMADGALCTPDLAACGVAGVARSRILRAAAAKGIAARIGRWRPDVILAADELMICNSVMGVRRVARLEGAACGSAGWTAFWNDALYETAE